MGINDNDKPRNPFDGLLQTLGAVTPLAIGVGYGIGQVWGNTPISPGDDPLTGRLGRRISRAQKNASEISKKVMTEDSFREWISTIEEQKAVIQGLLVSLDDPTLGIEAASAESFKHQLMGLAAKMDVNGTNDTEKLVSSLVNTVLSMDTTGKARDVMRANIRDFNGPAGRNLVVPNFKIESGQAFTVLNGRDDSLDSATWSKVEARAERFRKKIGAAMSTSFELVRPKHSPNAVYGRLSVGTKVKTFPLYFGTNHAGTRMYYAGENYVTPYIAPGRVALDTSAYEHLMKGNRDLLGATIETEDFFLNELLESITPSRSGISIRNEKELFSKFREIMAEGGAGVTRMGLMPNSGIQQHTAALGKIKGGIVPIIETGKLNKSQRNHLLANLAVATDVGRDLSSERMAKGMAVRREFSPLAIFKIPGIDNPNYGHMPLIARYQQGLPRDHVFNRQGMTLPGSGIQLGAGKAWQASELLTGGTNRIVVYDFNTAEDFVKSKGKRGRTGAGLAGKGMGYQRISEQVIKNETMLLLDPQKHGYLTTDILNRVVGAKGEFVEFSIDELLANGGLVSEGPGGRNYLSIDPYVKKARIALQDSTEAYGKHQLHLAVQLFQEPTIVKVFSPSNKGDLETVSSRTFNKILKQTGVSSRFLNQRLGAGAANEAIIVAGDTVEKSPGAMMRVMSGALSLFGKVSEADLGNVLKANMPLNDAILNIADIDQVSSASLDTARTAYAVASALKARNATDEEIGFALGGVWKSGSWWKSNAGNKNSSAAVITGIVNTVFGSRANDIMAHVQKGVSIGVETLTHGGGQGDSRMGRVGMEPRLIQSMIHRLNMTGMPEDDIFHIVNTMFSNKVGHQSATIAYMGLKKTLDSISGIGNLGTGDLPRLTLADIPGIMTNDKDIRRFLNKHKNGFLLDLTQGNAPGDDTVGNLAKRVLGPRGEIYISGKEMLDAMRGTVIKSQGASQYIGSEYERTVKHLFENLSSYLNPQREIDAKELEKSLLGFKGNITDMFTAAHYNLPRGKMKGSTYVIGQAYDKTFNAGQLSKPQLEYIRRASSVSKGQAVFADSKMFLNAMRDFAGTDVSDKDLGNMMKMFFTSGVADKRGRVGRLAGGKYGRGGLSSMSVRYPVQTVGNTALAQVYRHAKEVAGIGENSDFAWDWFMTTAEGKSFNQSFNGKYKSFFDIANASGSVQEDFFGRMAKALPQYAYRGGGTLFFAESHLNIKINGETIQTAHGLAAAAGGDFDKDEYQITFFDRKTAQKVKKYSTGTNVRSYLASDIMYQAKQAGLVSMAKKGMANMGMTLGGDVTDFVARTVEEAKMESAAKLLVGQLENQMGVMKSAIINSATPENISVATDALTLMGMLQEHTTLKSKKLPIFMPYAERLTGLIKNSLESGDFSSLQNFLKSDIFTGTELATTGRFTVEDISTPLGGKVNGYTKGMSSVFDLNEVFSFMTKASNLARTEAGVIPGSAGQAQALLNQGGLNEYLYHKYVLGSAVSLESGLGAGLAADDGAAVLSNMDSLYTKVVSAASTLDSRLAGPIAVGMAASLAASAVIGGNSYGPQVLDMPGESRSPRLADAVALGTIMGNRNDPVVDINQGTVDHLSTPINTGTAIFEAPNSYQIRGELRSAAGLDRLNSYLSPLLRGGHSSISINDNRRPLSPSYIDRIMGEY